MKIVRTEPIPPRPHKLFLTNAEAEFIYDIYNLASELENATMGICSRKEILENFIEEYINNKDKETIVIDLDEYYD